MNHQEYIKEVKSASTCILFIHGILGSPNHFDDFIPLIPSDYSIYNILLDGHGKGVKDFAKTSKSKWISQIEKTLMSLSNKFENIYIVAHSMGTLLTLQNITKYSKIKSCFLLATPLKIILKPSMVLTSIKIYLNKIKETDIKTQEAKRCYGISSDYNIFKYLGWIPRFLDLFSLSKKTKKIINNINIPCFVYLSKEDEVISTKSRKLLDSNNYMHVDVLNKSSHFYYEKQDKEYLLHQFKIFIENINNKVFYN